MKKMWIIGLGIVAILSSCKQAEESEEFKLLQAEKIELEQKLANQELAVSDFTEGMAAIQGSLREITIREDLLSGTVIDDAEMAKSPKEQIIRDISLVDALIKKNHEKIAALEAKMKGKNGKIFEFEKIVANLKLDLLEKEKSINSLKESLVAIEASYAQLFEEYQAQKMVSGMQDQALHKVWFAYGSKKELEEMNVIAKEGGVLGLGATYTLKDDFNKEYFTEMDDRELNRIPLNATKVRMVSTHPDSSYELQKSGKTFTELLITDPTKFWSGSKYLVILVE